MKDKKIIYHEDFKKHSVTFENGCWKKVCQLAEENGLTVSAVLNGIIKSVSDFKCQMTVGFADGSNVTVDTGSKLNI